MAESVSPIVNNAPVAQPPSAVIAHKELPAGGADREICHCKSVNLRTIVSAIRAGAQDVDAVGTACEAGTGCGTCRPTLANLIAGFSKKRPAAATVGATGGTPASAMPVAIVPASVVARDFDPAPAPRVFEPSAALDLPAVAGSLRDPARKVTPIEQIKAAKDGIELVQQLEQFAEIGWEKIPKDDLEHRLKWVGIFWRKSTPGKFMLRLRVPNGVLNGKQLRRLAGIVEDFGDPAIADVTTRQNIQIRGLKIRDFPAVFRRLAAVGLTTIQSGMDNVRNVVGSPVAGLDPDEWIDTRPVVRIIDGRITDSGRGNPAYTNLPRKFNIAVIGSRMGAAHAYINDLGLVAAKRNGRVGFNVYVGGFMGNSGVELSQPLDAFVLPESAADLAAAVLRVYRDNGPREKRYGSRLWHLIKEWGMERLRLAVQSEFRAALPPASPDQVPDWDHTDYLGVRPQKPDSETGRQLHFVGLHVPVGRIDSEQLFELARLADMYGSGEIRLTVERNVILPGVRADRLAELLDEPLLAKLKPDPAPLSRHLVSCTGVEFCNLAVIETKNRALRMISALEAGLEIDNPIRIHWSGCPSSCGQSWIGDIGLIGTKAKKDGKTVDAVTVLVGGRIDHEARLAQEFADKVPVDDLPNLLANLLVDRFGARRRGSAGSDLRRAAAREALEPAHQASDEARAKHPIAFAV